jgi:hypothetical protein
MEKLFRIGDIIDGFCNGYFGRDDYEKKICVIVNEKYAIFEYLDGNQQGMAVVLNQDENLDGKIVDEWIVKIKE